jgi:hypothetical protein
MKEFIDLIEAMRTTQKEYFLTRSSKSLHDSKKLEKEVDQTISYFKKYNHFPPPPPIQTHMEL